MSERFRAADHLERLKDFQQRTVRHVVGRLYDDGDDAARRFLVADETGLGKSVIARGVVAEALERLLADDRTERIDVVYVCSNSGIAKQNLSRLDVTGGATHELDTRLTMLAAHASRLQEADRRWGKPVNVIAFTPGTSFAKGWQTGKVQERALLAVILQQLLSPSARERTALHRALQGGVAHLTTFRDRVGELEGVELDATVVEAFTAALHRESLLDDVRLLVDDVGQRRTLPDDLRERAKVLIRRLRDQLASAGVAALEPDLIILDEFQRFRHLLDREVGGGAADLAHSLFEWDQARTLLLSATPYRPFTLHEEDDQGEDHYADFLATLRFLSSDDEAWLGEVQAALAEHRSSLVSGRARGGAAPARLRELLLRFMCRTERPVVAGAHREVVEPVAVTPADLVDSVGLRRLAGVVDAPMSVDYWKSAPYFANFLDGYVVGRRLRDALGSRRVSRAVDVAMRAVSVLDPGVLQRFEECELGNPRLRLLAERTTGAGWWRLLWVPPSMPYTAPASAYAEPGAQDVTKQLVFSSWSATPTAVAGLLSYDAVRRAAAGRDLVNSADARSRVAGGLEYSTTGDGDAGSMSTLALFWPHPALAALADPLAAARERPDDLLSSEQVTRWALDRLTRSAAAASTAPPAAGDDAVADFFAWPGDHPAGLRRSALQALSAKHRGEEAPDADDGARTSGTDVGLAAHVDAALGSATRWAPSAELARLAAFSPANTAWRAVRRLVRDDDVVEPSDLWQAAAVLATGLRSLFSRFESALVLRQLYPGVHHWQRVLAYCADGNLQAVLDEHLHTQRSAVGDQRLSGPSLLELVGAAAAPLSMRPSQYLAFDPRTPEARIQLMSRFALRYGAARGQGEDVRLPEVRQAFNSPFWPFVLASTSAGQEGIDFHWWSHSVVHWNTPANPVDFEQREGRVNRFGGHAVRRNVALRHRGDALRSQEQDPWKAAYDAAAAAETRYGDFCPYWVYPGPHAVERRLMPYPMSVDEPRAAAMKRSLAHYRLALGQPRQEDLLGALRSPGGVEPLDLRPR